jgi:hypothetical protein
MKNSLTGNDSNDLHVELKFCERCGALWVRQCGGGQVYCDNCLPQVAQLPAPHRVRTFPQLPVGKRAFVDDLEIDFSDLDELDLESAGGVA